MDLSIGAFANATGVPANTLRTWERRYGFPVARRTAGGQRVYDADTIERVRLVAGAIERGHRPAQLVGASLPELCALAGGVGAGARSEASVREEPGRRAAPAESISDWVLAAAALDGDALDGAFRSALANTGLEAFLTLRAAPFLEAVGEAWAAGRIQPFHEHFASERLRDFLVAAWRPLAESNMGPVAVLATMPAERHGLGLHMAACHAAAAGWRLVFLGVETPLPDIDACARQSAARAVMISVSSASNPAQAAWDLAALRARLPAGVRLIAGGAGAPAAGGDHAWERVDGFGSPELRSVPGGRAS